MTTYYAALLRPGALWNPDKTVREQPFWDEHARFMDSPVYPPRLRRTDLLLRCGKTRRDLEVKCRFKKTILWVAAFGLAAMALTNALAGAWQPGSRASAAGFKNGSQDLNYSQARKAMRGGKCDEAAKIYERLVELDASDFKAWLGLSFAYLKLSDYARCFDAASKVLTAERSNARAYALAGVALLRLGYLKQASAALQNAINLDPKEALAFGGAAEVDYYEGRVNEARRWSLYAHNLDPNEPDYLVTYARASSRAEDFKEAADAYERFMRIAPERDAERRDRIRGLISFYRQLSGLRIHQVAGAEHADAPFYLGSDRRPYLRVRLNGRDALFVIDTGSGFTVVSREAAKRFGVQEIARGGKSQGVGGPASSQSSTASFGRSTSGQSPCEWRPASSDRFTATPGERPTNAPTASSVCRFCLAT